MVSATPIGSTPVSMAIPLSSGKVSSRPPTRLSRAPIQPIRTKAALALASAAFVLVGWIGARDKRVGGLLLTFPLLNGIAMLTGVDPIGVAETIYVMVIWNCLLFWGVMHGF